jgi:ketosteroid isomerase-like protein
MEDKPAGPEASVSVAPGPDSQGGEPAGDRFDVPADPQEKMKAYLEAVTNRDLPRIMAFFADDAKILVMSGVFQGREAIEQWHQERIEAEAQLVRLDGIRVNGDTVTIDGVITSKRLKAWRIPNIPGRATVGLEDGKIKEMKLSLRGFNPLEGW